MQKNSQNKVFCARSSVIVHELKVLLTATCLRLPYFENTVEYQTSKNVTL